MSQHDLSVNLTGSGCLVSKPYAELEEKAGLSTIISRFQVACRSQGFLQYCSKLGFLGPTFHPNANLIHPHNQSINKFWEALSSNPSARLGVVFHGTPKKNIQRILLDGLDPRKRLRQAYGPGEYFSTDPTVSAEYSDSLALVVCLVILPGSVGNDHRLLTRPCPSSLVVIQDSKHHVPIGTLSFSSVVQGLIKLKAKVPTGNQATGRATSQRQSALALQRRQQQRRDSLGVQQQKRLRLRKKMMEQRRKLEQRRLKQRMKMTEQRRMQEQRRLKQKKKMMEQRRIQEQRMLEVRRRELEKKRLREARRKREMERKSRLEAQRKREFERKEAQRKRQLESKRTLQKRELERKKRLEAKRKRDLERKQKLEAQRKRELQRKRRVKAAKRR